MQPKGQYVLSDDETAELGDVDGESLVMLRSVLKKLVGMYEFIEHLSYIDSMDMETSSVPYPDDLSDLIRLFDTLLDRPGVEDNGTMTLENLHVRFVLMWVNHLETATKDIQSLISEHEIMEEENMAKLTSMKDSKFPGRKDTLANGPAQRVKNSVTTPPSSAPAPANRSIIVSSMQHLNSEEISLGSGQHRAKRSRNNVEMDPATLGSGLPTINLSTAHLSEPNPCRIVKEV